MRKKCKCKGRKLYLFKKIILQNTNDSKSILLNLNRNICKVNFTFLEKCDVLYVAVSVHMCYIFYLPNLNFINEVII